MKRNKHIECPMCCEALRVSPFDFNVWYCPRCGHERKKSNDKNITYEWNPKTGWIFPMWSCEME